MAMNYSREMENLELRSNILEVVESTQLARETVACYKEIGSMVDGVLDQQLDHVEKGLIRSF